MIVLKKRELNMKNVIERGKIKANFSLVMSKSLPQLKVELNKQIARFKKD